MEIFAITVFIVIFVVILYLAIKNENTSIQQDKIIGAIHNYNLDHTGVDFISYWCMEPYSKTLFRWHDWSYKNIVPPDVLTKITPYIKK